VGIAQLHGSVEGWLHPFSSVDLVGPNAVTIGKGTKVWQFASVIRRSQIGEDCCIASCAIVDGCRLGDRVRVSHGAFLDPGMRIGDDVFIGPGVKFCNDIWPRSHKDGWFDMEELCSGRIIVTEVNNGASIGAGAIIMPGLTIGARAMIAAGAVVSFDVPPDHLYRANNSIEEIRKEPNRRRFVVAAHGSV
jgi:UDP-2-acetamido-3-amino-2,3-dideoxy-glucuronate N-acetyltransferase